MNEIYDVLIIGGGPAGLSAALSLARGNKKVLIIDEGKGRNAPAAHMMNFPSRDGTPLYEFRRLIREDLSKYTNCQIMNGRVEKLVRIEQGFELNGYIKGRKVLLAHGIKDLLPPVTGFQELFGKSIFHCPYCHGYEHRGSAIGLIANEQIALHLVPLLKGLTSDLILFSNGERIEDRAIFEKNGIKVYDGKIKELLQEGDQLKALVLNTGEKIERDFLFLRPRNEMTTSIGMELGCELNEHGLYKVDNMGMTTQEGIYAAGDVMDMRQSVIMACASGSFAGASINLAIAKEHFYGT